MVASGGRQWKNVSDSDYFARSSDLDHMDVAGMMELIPKDKDGNELKDSSGNAMTIKDYIEEMSGRNCCE